MKILAKSHRAWYKKGWGDPRFWCCRKEADATSMEESSCVERLREMLNRGVWAEGELLPSEYELARQLDVSRSEILEALMVLEEEKYLVRHHGIGWVVGARPVFSIRLEELISVSDMITRSGCSAGTVVLGRFRRETGSVAQGAVETGARGDGFSTGAGPDSEWETGGLLFGQVSGFDG